MEDRDNPLIRQHLAAFNRKRYVVIYLWKFGKHMSFLIVGRIINAGIWGLITIQKSWVMSELEKLGVTHVSQVKQPLD